jgi:hypothetical protein
MAQNGRTSQQKKTFYLKTTKLGNIWFDFDETKLKNYKKNYLSRTLFVFF